MSRAGTKDVNSAPPSLVDKRPRLLDLLAPPRCQYCRATTDLGVCEGCQAELPWNREACPGCALPSAASQLCRGCRRRPRRFDSAWTAFVLAEPIHASLLGLKYRSGFAEASVLGRLMAAALLTRNAPLPDVLIPVPLHAWRSMRRGYNQAALLAAPLRRALNIPIDRHALVRTGAGADQIGQSAAARRANLRGVFSARRDLSGLHIALIDDVMTTGATFDELAKVCRRAGARHIEAWAVARTP